MTTLRFKDKEKEFELKFSIMLDKLLNKEIKDDEETKKGKEKLSGGISKILPQLIEMDIETLAKLFEVAIKHAPKERSFKVTFDEILEAIDDQMNEDDDATIIFKEVFEAIDRSAFSRNELAKFVTNMSLVKEMRTEEISAEKADMMIKRMNGNYEKITGKTLIEIESTVKTEPEEETTQA